MRQIKFRVWNRKLNKMQKPLPPWEAGDGDCKQIFFDWEPWDADKLQLDLMQFTELLDKNEKEIYEGDIVKDEDDSIWIVVWIDASFWFQNPNDKSNRNTYDWLKDQGFWKEIQIIGNIHENPELLK